MNIEEYQQQFLQLLHTSVVTFHYRKKDRSLRKAIGTTCLDLIPTDSLVSFFCAKSFVVFVQILALHLYSLVIACTPMT